MIKVLTIIGTRPEAIKMAPVIMELKRFPEYFETKVCTTAQHREMLDQVLQIFDIVTDVDLNLMEQNQSLPKLTGCVMLELSKVLQEEKPDILLIQGDTTTVMTASLAAFYQKIPVGHVEAGLRTQNIYSPFPEEMNRRLTSVLANYHFAPTERAKNALLKESVLINRIFVTGNTVIDALHLILEKPQPKQVKKIIRSGNVSANGKKLILVTAHRRENFGDPFENICAGLKELAERNPDISIIYPVHLNPHVREPAFRILNNTSGVFLTDPVEYDVMAHLMKESYLILTDSGGIQEEAPALGKPVLVLREETERPEAVEAGAAKVIGTFADDIVRETEKLLKDSKEYKRMAKTINPYGDGKASYRIAEIIKNLYLK